MTDKEIIIDGVNVVECRFRCYIDRCMAHSCTTKPCKENKNCYYKQLQRKEQECEELNEDIQGLKTNLLEKENCSARYYQIVTHREQNELYKKFDYQRTQKEKFKQALEKIEETLTSCESCDVYNTPSMLDKCVGCLPQRVEEAVKLINEVKNE